MSTGGNDSASVPFGWFGALLSGAGLIAALPPAWSESSRTLLATLGALLAGVLGQWIRGVTKDGLEIRANVRKHERRALRAEAERDEALRELAKLQSHLALPALTDAAIEASESTGEWTPPKGA